MKVVALETIHTLAGVQSPGGLFEVDQAEASRLIGIGAVREAQFDAPTASQPETPEPSAKGKDAKS